MAPINLPNGNEVSEIVLPDGSSASEVIAPDGSTVFSAIPDSNLYLRIAAYEDSRSAGSVSSIPDQAGDNDLSGSASIVDNGVNGLKSYEIDGQTISTAFSTLSQPTYIALSYEAISVDNSTSEFIYTSDGDADPRQIFNLRQPNLTTFAGSNLISSTAEDTDPHVHEAAYDGADSEQYQDDNSIASGDTGTAGLAGLQLGDGTARFYLREMLVYTADKRSNRSDVYGWLADNANL
jgi:hypothetical protein